MNLLTASLVSAMRPPALGLRGTLAVTLGACLALAGCSAFKPKNDPVRYFMLTPLPAVEAAAMPPGASGLGIGQVKCPAYLTRPSLAVRRGANEVEYLPFAHWSERLDLSLQRVLAANLAAFLPTDQIRLSAWRSEDVSVEVHVTIERFDVDADGQGALVAWWRLLSPGGERTLKSGQAQLTRKGPSPDTDPAGAVATLSELMADLSRELAQALRPTLAR